MFFLQRFRRGELRLNRVEAFSDGVFAIIVTLLVLELKVPALEQDHSVEELAQRLVSLLPKFISWLVSFIIVAKFWLNHHHTLGLARHANYALVWLNAIFLMLQSFIPFPSALMGEYPTNPLAVSFFGIVMVINTFCFIGLHLYIVRHLIKPADAPAQDPKYGLKALIGPASYALGAILAWVNVYAAFAMYFITPLFYIVPPDNHSPTPPSTVTTSQA